MQWIDLFLHERGSVGSAAGHGATAAYRPSIFWVFFKQTIFFNRIHIATSQHAASRGAPGEREWDLVCGAVQYHIASGT